MAIARRNIVIPPLVNPITNGVTPRQEQVGTYDAAAPYRTQQFSEPQAPNFSTPQQQAIDPAAVGAQAPLEQDATAIETVGQSAAPQKPTFDPSTGSVVSQGQPQYQPTGAYDAQLHPQGGNNAGGVESPYQRLISNLRMKGFGNNQSEDTPEDAARKAKNQAKVASMLNLFTGIGNMLVTSSNRFGRAVQSPDFAKPVAEGIASKEKQRREQEALDYERAYKEQQAQLQRDKLAADANKRQQDIEYRERQLRQQAEKNNRDLELRAKNYQANIEKANKDRESRERMDEANRKSREKIAWAQIKARKDAAAAKGSGNGGATTKVDKDVTNITLSNGYEMNLPHSKWHNSAENVRHAYEMAYKLHPEFFDGDESKWTEDDGRLKVNDDLRQAISAYIGTYEYDDVTKYLMMLNGDDPNNPEIVDRYFTTSLDGESSNNGSSGNGSSGNGVRTFRRKHE